MMLSTTRWLAISVLLVSGCNQKQAAVGEIKATSGVFDYSEHYVEPLAIARSVGYDSGTTIDHDPSTWNTVSLAGVAGELPLAYESPNKAIADTNTSQSVPTNATAADTDYENIISGTDDRVQVEKTDGHPFRTAGMFSNGCTGTVVAPRIVLTAGHCVYNITTDKWYESLRFIAGRNGDAKPFGTVAWSHAIAPKGWTESHDYNYDYAIVVLDERIGDKVGWLGYGMLDDAALTAASLNLMSYPGDKPAGTLWLSYCPVKSLTERMVRHSCDTYQGASGGGLYVKAKNDRVLYAIHSHSEGNENVATRISDTVYKRVQQVIEQYP